MPTHKIILDPVFIVKLLSGITFLLLIASIIGSVIFYATPFTCLHSVSLFFFFDYELNIPTYFSSLLLLFASVILMVITFLEKKQTVSEVRYWAVLSAGFLLMSFDELVSFHERLVKPMSKLLGSGNHGILHFSWVIPGMFIVIVLGCFFARFLIRLHSKTRFTFILAAVIYTGGCIGLELIGGKYFELFGVQSLIYIASATLEELMEMAGVILFIWGLLVYIADNYGGVQFQFNACRSKSFLLDQLPVQVAQPTKVEKLISRRLRGHILDHKKNNGARM